MTALPPLGPVAGDLASRLSPDDLVSPPPVQAGADSGSFAQLFSHGIERVNEQLLAGDAALQRLATGDMQNLHQVMIKLEESRLSFQLLMQVRSRVLEAYQDVMKMQV